MPANNKRERDNSSEEEEKQIFSTSKIVLRSPNYNTRNKEVQQQPKMEAQIVKLLSEIKSIREDMAKKDSVMLEMVTEIKQMREDMIKRDKEIAQILQEVKQIKVDHKKAEKNWNCDRVKILDKIRKLEIDREKAEKENRKLNIVIKGLSAEQLENRSELDKLFLEKLDIKCKIKNTTTVGKEEERKMLVVEMNTFEDKLKLLEKKKKLAGTNIYIENDLTREERRVQREIRAVAREQRNQGKTVKVSYQKLKINGKEFRWSRDEEGLIPVPSTSKNS